MKFQIKKGFSKAGWQRLEVYHNGCEMKEFNTRTFRDLNLKHVEEHIEWLKCMVDLEKAGSKTKFYSRWSDTDLKELYQALCEFMNNKKIIAVFSCVGKTHYVLNNYEHISCIDHDFYDWMYRGQLGNNWMQRYIHRMIQLTKKFDYIFVNATPEIIRYLPKEAIIIHPTRELKDEWIRRAQSRGGITEFSKLLEREWDEWIDACRKWPGKRIEIVNPNQHLTDIDLKLI